MSGIGQFVGGLACQFIGGKVSSYIHNKIINPYILKPIGLGDSDFAATASTTAISAGLAGLSLLGATAAAAYAGPVGISYYGGYGATWALSQLTSIFVGGAISGVLSGAVQMTDKCLLNPALHYLELDGTNTDFVIKTIEKVGISVAAAHLASEFLAGSAFDTSYKLVQDKMIGISNLKSVASLAIITDNRILDAGLIKEIPGVQVLDGEVGRKFMVENAAWTQAKTSAEDFDNVANLTAAATQVGPVTNETLAQTKALVDAANKVAKMHYEFSDLKAQAAGGIIYNIFSSIGTGLDYLVVKPFSYIDHGFSTLFPSANDSIITNKVATISGMTAITGALGGFGAAITRNEIETTIKSNIEAGINQLKAVYPNQFTDAQLSLLADNALRDEAIKVYHKDGLRIDGFDQQLYTDILAAQQKMIDAAAHAEHEVAAA